MNIASATPRPASPVKSCLCFAQAIGAGELDRAASCFARDGCLITPDATAVHGREEIRAVLAQMIGRETEVEIELSSTVAAGEVILASQRWLIRSGEPGERRLEQKANAVLVLRRIEAEWKFAIVAPWGYRQSFP